MHTFIQVEPFPDIHLPVAGELAIGAATSAWIAEGFRVVRSLAIDSACAPFSHSACPHTGKSPCDCLLAVLLVSRNGDGPAPVVAHGHEDVTTFSLQQEGLGVDSVTVERIWQTLRSLAGPVERIIDTRCD
jgi:hypothetical protein